MAGFSNYADVAAALKAESDVWSRGGGHTDTAVRERALAAREWWANHNASPTSAPSYSPPPPPPPAPPLPNFTPMTVSNKNFKVAPSDIIQFEDDSVDIALIQDLLFEDIGAIELANISRSDLIDGQPTVYSPIRNLPIIRREYNPNNIIAVAPSSDYFSRFGINLISRGIYEPYFDENGDLVIEIDTIESDEEIQVEIVSSGTIDVVEAA